MEIKNILACVDSSDYGVSVSRFSCFIAKKFNAHVKGFHVIDIMQLEGPFMYDLSGALGFEPFGDFSSKIRAILEEKGKNVLMAFESIAKDFGVEYSSEMETGVVSSTILSAESEYDIVCLGLKGVNEDYERGILGSNIESVLRRSKKTLLVVPKHFYTPSVVLAFVNEKEISLKAYEYAKAFADRFGIEFKAIYFKKNDVSLPDDVEVREADRVADAIEEEIKKVEKPIVFMGAYAKSKLKEILLGSTTENVLKKELGVAFMVVR
ncbi:universal stress protein [Hippea alviniae]|uniref:universal stress protein n=1 Tax=Hippea alviniae TaxID=1279027 RepID=UPI0003B53FBC|nr:universal stress protein [Hippea alviniae]